LSDLEDDSEVFEEEMQNIDHSFEETKVFDFSAEKDIAESPVELLHEFIDLIDVLREEVETYESQTLDKIDNQKKQIESLIEKVKNRN